MFLEIQIVCNIKSLLKKQEKSRLVKLIIVLLQKYIDMGYYSERLRQRLENMTFEQKQALWDKYSYLNEYGPVVTSHTEYFYYGEDIPCISVSVPETALCVEGNTYRLAA